LEIPYTGSGVLASAVGMDKVMTKRLLDADKIPTPPWCHLQWPAQERPPALPKFGRFPVVVKPACEGSTVGVSIVMRREELPAAVELAHRYGDELLLEDFIDGHEVTVAVLDGQPLPPIEIIPAEPFYNYEAKYTPGRCDYQLPPIHVAEPSWRQAQALAARVHRLLGCSGATRVDFRVDPAGKPFVLEINTVPGMTETSLLPKAAAAAGLEYDALVVRILASARERVAARS
jgi:D-alanine-D-alanine ligase